MMRTLACVLVIVATVPGCPRDRDRGFELARTEQLPGFDVSVPGGEPFRAERTPASGELLYRRGGSVIAVGWQAGKILEADLPQFADATARALGAVISGADVDHRRLSLAAPDYGFTVKFAGKDGMRLEVSVIQCTKSNVTVTLGSVGSIDHHERLVASLRCGTEAAAQSTAVGLPDFDQREDVGYLPGSDPPAYYSLTGDAWIITPGTSSARKAVTNQAAVREMFGAMGLEVRDVKPLAYTGKADWVQQELAVSIDGEPTTMLLGSLACGGGAEFMVIYASIAGDTPALHGQLDRVRCPSGAVDPSGLPSVQGRFGAACDAGQGAACATLADLVEQEPALLTGLDAAALRAKACTLGVAEACP